jgi:ArsR family transcriptional regulator
MFSAMGTEARLRIMQLLLSAHPDGLVVNEIHEELEIPNSTLSHHLEKLKNEGLALVKRERTFLRYTADTDALQQLLQFLYAECCTRNKALKPEQNHGLQVSKIRCFVGKREEIGHFLFCPSYGSAEDNEKCYFSVLLSISTSTVRLHFREKRNDESFVDRGSTGRGVAGLCSIYAAKCGDPRRAVGKRI